MTTHRMTQWLAVAALVGLGVGVRASGSGQAAAPRLAGMWDGTGVVTQNINNVPTQIEVPFPFEITDVGGKPKASFLNGSQRISSTSSAIDGDKVVFTFAQYNTTLNTTYKDGTLSGEYVRPKGRGAPLPFRAAKAAAVAASSEKAPAINGVWITQARSNKGEQAWRFIADQKGNQLTATILRVDGDTGTLYGSFKDGKFVLGHFSGARPTLVEVTPNADGTLTISQNKGAPLMAARENVASAKGIGTPTDPAAHTSMKDPNEPFTFAFPNMKGEIKSNTDPQFRGKVLLINISGSWCPNCHDETPFLVNLYKKYRAKGFEVVQLSFEEDDQQPGLTRLKGFNENYGIEWTVLVPGNPDQLNEKVPQANNLNAFPTSFFVGRDGRVRAVHAGFPSPGSGQFYTDAEKEVTALVEKLLAEAPPRTSAR